MIPIILGMLIIFNTGGSVLNKQLISIDEIDTVFELNFGGETFNLTKQKIQSSHNENNGFTGIQKIVRGDSRFGFDVGIKNFLFVKTFRSVIFYILTN